MLHIWKRVFEKLDSETVSNQMIASANIESAQQLGCQRTPVSAFGANFLRANGTSANWQGIAA
jgi:hypothetical protein